MQYAAKTPQEYLTQLTDDWRKLKLQEIRAMIRKHGPNLTENMEYKMLAFGDGNKNIIHLNAQSAYVSLYVGNISKIKDAPELLKDFNLGKGCIRIKKSVALSNTGLEAFIKSTIELYERGGNTDC